MAKMTKKGVEAMKLRGIAASIQALECPQFMNLNEMLEEHGYRLLEIDAANKIYGQPKATLLADDEPYNRV